MLHAGEYTKIPDPLTVQIGADSSKLRADLAAVQDQIKDTAAELRDAAKEFNAGNISGTQLQEVAGRYEELRGRASGLSAEIRGTGAAAKIAAAETGAWLERVVERLKEAKEAGEHATSSVGGLVSVIARLATNPIALVSAAFVAVALAAVEAAKSAAENAHELTAWANVLGVMPAQTKAWEEAATRASVPAEALMKFQERFQIALEKSAETQRKLIIESAKLTADSGANSLVARGGRASAATKPTSELIDIAQVLPIIDEKFRDFAASRRTAELNSDAVKANYLPPPLPPPLYERQLQQAMGVDDPTGKKLRDDAFKFNGYIPPAYSRGEALDRTLPGFRDELTKLVAVLEPGTLKLGNFTKAFDQFQDSLGRLPLAEANKDIRTIGGKAALEPNLSGGLREGKFKSDIDEASEATRRLNQSIATSDAAYTAVIRKVAEFKEGVNAIGRGEIEAGTAAKGAFDEAFARLGEVNQKAADFKTTLDASLGPNAIEADTASFKDLAGAIGVALDGIISKARAAGAAISQAVSSATSAQAASGADTSAPPSGPFFASGGYVRGPGSGTSDSILARVSNGEYVMNAASTARLGVGYLNSLNNYAMGGLVGRLSLPSFASGGAVSGGVPVHLHIGGRSFETTAGQSVATALIQEARSRQMLSAGARPSWRSS